MAILIALLAAFLGMIVGERSWDALIAGLAAGALTYGWQQLQRLRADLDGLNKTIQGFTSKPAMVETARREVPPENESQGVTPVTQTAPTPPPARAEAARTAWPPPPRFEFELGERLLAVFARTNVAVRVGVVVLFFGVAFLVKYAADHAAFPLKLRLASAFVGGLVMLALGWRLRHRRREYALVIQGGGIGVMYLTVYAAFRLFQLLPAGVAFLLLALIALGAGTLAVLQDARILAVFGTVGGLLAPLLASTGHGSHVVLFSYYLILNLMIVAIAWFKTWRWLTLIGMFFTFVVSFLWGYRFYSPAFFASTEPFLLAYFLIYTSIPLLFARQRAVDLKNSVDGPLVFGVPLAVLFLQATMVSRYEYGLAWSCAGFGLYYLALSLSAARGLHGKAGVLVQTCLNIGIIFLSLAVPYAFSKHVTSEVWALEGAGTLWLGCRQADRRALLFGALLECFAGMLLIMAVTDHIDHWHLSPSAWTGALIVTVAALASAYALQKDPALFHAVPARLSNLAVAYGLAWWLFSSIAKLHEWLPSGYFYGTVLLFLSATWLACAAGVKVLRWPQLENVYLLYLPAIAITLLVQSGAVEHPLGDFGYVGWPLALAVGYWLLGRLEHSERLNSAAAALHAASLWLAVAVGALELHWQLPHLIRATDTWQWLGPPLAGITTIGVVLLLEQSGRGAVARFRSAYFTMALPPIALGLALWCVAASLLLAGAPDPLPYIPLLNPVDLVSVLALGSTAVFLKRGRELIPDPAKHLDFALLGLVGVLIVTAIALRAVHFLASVPYEWQAMAASQLAQTSLSVLWPLLAVLAMLYGSRAVQPMAWFGGAALMGIVVIKLFIFDLAGLETLARILAFMVVGVLLLAVGYYAPAPPHRPRTA